MRGRTDLFGRAIHPMLVVFPLALLATSVAFDVLHRVRRGGWVLDDPYNGWWAVLAYWLIATGVLGGLAATPFGVLDWLALPAGSRAKALGRWHGLGNTVVLSLFAGGWLLRRDAPHNPGVLELVMSLAGLGLVMVTAWLGTEVVGQLGGPGAGAAEPALDAPNSLLDVVFERHPVYAGRRVKEVWGELTEEAATAQVAVGQLAEAGAAGDGDARDRARLAALGERWAPFAGSTWTHQPPRQVASARVLWEYFREQHPGGTTQMYDVWLADSELRRRGAPGFPRRAAMTCGVLMALSALWACGLLTALAALLD